MHVTKIFSSYILCSVTHLYKQAGGWKQLRLQWKVVVDTVAGMEGKEKGSYSRFYILFSCQSFLGYLHWVQQFRIQ
jgi:hypothetical protein